MIPEDVDLANILRSALRRAGIVTGYKHLCRRSGCEHRELAQDNALRRCPKCNMKLWSSGIVRPIRFHDTRHTTATLLLKAGVPLATVQKILRHTDSRITSEIYGHLDISDMQEGMKKLAEKMPIPFVVPPEMDENPAQAAEGFAANLLPKAEIEDPTSEEVDVKPWNRKGKSIGAAGFEPAAFWSQRRRRRINESPSAPRSFTILNEFRGSGVGPVPGLHESPIAPRRFWCQLWCQPPIRPAFGRRMVANC
jgi:integrase